MVRNSLNAPTMKWGVMKFVPGLLLLGALLPPLTTSAEVGSERVYKKALYAWPIAFDPAQMNDAASLVFSNLVYEGLLRFRQDLSIEGSLAESWQTLDGGKVFRFKLREQAKFHDGSLVRASDVVASLKRLIAPKSLVANYYMTIKGAREYHRGNLKQKTGIREVDLSTVEIELTHPFPPFLSVLAGATAKVFPKGAVDEAQFFAKPNGAGPFRILALDKRARPPVIHLERFAGATEVVPRLSRLDLVVLNETEAASAAEQGQIDDLANWPLVGNESFFKKGQHLSGPLSATWIIGLNSRSKALSNVETRIRLRDAIDSEAFRKRFYPDSLPAYGYVPPGLPGYLEKAEKEQERPSAAKERTSIELAIPAELARAEEMGQWLEVQFKSRGLLVKPRVIPWAKLMEGYNTKTLDAFLLSMNVDYPDPEFLFQNFESTNRDNFSGVSDSVIDRLLMSARSEQDRNKRAATYRELATVLHSKAPTINLFHPKSHIWVSRCVRGVEPNLLSDVVIDYRKVDFDTQCLSKASGAL